ncbi:hypothetical protein [Saccharopolyspora cebuensis]|uniref:Uncharacterized protein n=1 Tax=Saccharopolyspora cebuensis TaxID=418759 RepID=A0ABV4CJQ3_9PSEU
MTDPAHLVRDMQLTILALDCAVRNALDGHPPSAAQLAELAATTELMTTRLREATAPARPGPLVIDAERTDR